MKLEIPLHLDDKNAVFYSSLHLLDEQIKYNKCEMRKISDLISKFFNDEKVAEIECIIGSSKITFDLKIVWKQLQVHLIVLVNKFGKAVFNFFIPNQRGFDKLVFENEDLPSIERLLNFLNIKKTGSAASHLVNFKIDSSKNYVHTTFSLTIFNEYFEGVSTKLEDQQNLFKKLCYLVFSNSLLRIKSCMHLFHFLARYPSLTVQKILDRTEFQLKSLLKVDYSKQSHFIKSYSEDIAVTNKNLRVSKTCLGRGGFGVVRYCMVYNKRAAMKIFEKKIDISEQINRDDQSHDSINEIAACQILNCASIFKLYGINFVDKNKGNSIAMFSSYVKGHKLSKCYEDILEESPNLIFQIIKDIAGAISFMHSRNIFHGDLSLSNVIVDYSERKEKANITLIDLGMSGDLSRDNITGLTVDFAAYEILTKDFKEQSKTKIDVFALGCIIFHLCYRTSFVMMLLK